MKILSWDVGIKNLAYCLIEKPDDKNEFEIKKWNVINLAEEQQLCQFSVRGGNQCQQVAKHEVKNKDKIDFCSVATHGNTVINGGSIFTCATHLDKFKPEFIEYSKKETRKCVFPKCKLDACKGIENSNNYCWCKTHFDKGSIQMLKKITIKKFTNKSCMKQSLQNLTVNLYGILDELKEFLQVDYVLIENQPSMKNPTMKTIAMLLFAYFVREGVHKKNENKSKIIEVKFICPSNKLKVDKATTSSVLKQGNVYKMTKKLGIKYCQALINIQDNVILNSHKKKDDMCDAFLQGFQYMFNPVPEMYIKKLHDVGVEEIQPKSKTTNIKVVKVGKDDNSNK